jgi:hypothetical protein
LSPHNASPGHKPGAYHFLAEEMGYRPQVASSACSQKKIPAVLSFVSLRCTEPLFCFAKGFKSRYSIQNMVTANL